MTGWAAPVCETAGPTRDICETGFTNCVYVILAHCPGMVHGRPNVDERIPVMVKVGKSMDLDIRLGEHRAEFGIARGAKLLLIVSPWCGICKCESMLKKQLGDQLLDVGRYTTSGSFQSFKEFFVSDSQTQRIVENFARSFVTVVTCGPVAWTTQMGNNPNTLVLRRSDSIPKSELRVLKEYSGLPFASAPHAQRVLRKYAPRRDSKNWAGARAT